MKYAVLSTEPTPRLLLIFAGWGMDEKPFVGLQREGYTTMIVWDYTDDALPPDVLQAFKEICVVGWSYGVYMGWRWMCRYGQGLPVTARIAINGTPWPIDAERGIAPEIFSATLAGLNEATLLKFNRRMLGGTAAYKAWAAHHPERSIESLRDELSAIANAYATTGSGDPSWWDTVVIASSDLIIPAASQRRAWADHPRLHEVEGPHWLPLSELLNALLVDKERVGHRFSRAVATYEREARVQLDAARHLLQMWRRVRSVPIERMIEIGAGTGLFTRLYVDIFDPQELELWDLIELPAELPGLHRRCDAELAIQALPSASLDAIVSTSSIQWFNSLRRFWREAARTLRSQGLVVVSTFGPSTFHEIRDILSPALPSPYPTLDKILEMLPTELEAIATDDEQYTLCFSSTQELLSHIKKTGVNGTSTSRADALRIASSGLRRLTFEPLYLILRRR